MKRETAVKQLCEADAVRHFGAKKAVGDLHKRLTLSGVELQQVCWALRRGCSVA